MQKADEGKGKKRALPYLRDQLIFGIMLIVTSILWDFIDPEKTLKTRMVNSDMFNDPFRTIGVPLLMFWYLIYYHGGGKHYLSGDGDKQSGDANTNGE